MSSVYDYINLDYSSIVFNSNYVNKDIIDKKTNKLYFLHLPKTAGGKLSGNINNNENSEVKFIPVDHGFSIDNSFKLAPEMGGFKHWPGNYFNKFQYKEGLNDACIFTIIRNPFDWLTSYYFHGNDGWADFNKIHKFNSFEQFIEAYCNPSYQWHCPLLKKFIYSPIFGDQDMCEVDFIIKYENMEEPLRKLNEHFGEKIFNLDYGKRDNVSFRKTRNYKEYYTPYLRSLVEKKCERELKLFNYNFDNSSNNQCFMYPKKILKYNIVNDVIYLKKYL